MNRLSNLWTKSKPDRERRTRACRSPAPEVGQMIACQHVMLRVTAPISDGLWSALSVLGWLVVDPQTERRNYAQLHPDAFDDLLFCDRKDLEDTHHALLLQKRHPLNIVQPKPTKNYRGLPSQLHWQAGQPLTFNTLVLVEE